MSATDISVDFHGQTTYCWAIPQSYNDANITNSEDVLAASGRDCPGSLSVFFESFGDAIVGKSMSVQAQLFMEESKFVENGINQTDIYADVYQKKSSTVEIAWSDFVACKVGSECDPFHWLENKVTSSSPRIGNFSDENRFTFRDHFVFEEEGEYIVMTHVVLPGKDRARYDYAAYQKVSIQAEENLGLSNTLIIVITAISVAFFLALTGFILFYSRYCRRSSKDYSATRSTAAHGFCAPTGMGSQQTDSCGLSQMRNKASTSSKMSNAIPRQTSHHTQMASEPAPAQVQNYLTHSSSRSSEPKRHNGSSTYRTNDPSLHYDQESTQYESSRYSIAPSEGISVAPSAFVDQTPDTTRLGHPNFLDIVDNQDEYVSYSSSLNMQKSTRSITTSEQSSQSGESYATRPSMQETCDFYDRNSNVLDSQRGLSLATIAGSHESGDSSYQSSVNLGSRWSRYTDEWQTRAPDRPDRINVRAGHRL